MVRFHELVYLPEAGPMMINLRLHVHLLNINDSETPILFSSPTSRYPSSFSSLFAVLTQLTLGPLRQAFLTQIYDFATDRLSSSINRFVVSTFESRLHVYPIDIRPGASIRMEINVF
jgi:hypothetical protein